MTGDELEQMQREQGDAMRRAAVKPMTCAVVLAWLAVGVMVVVIVVGSFWLVAWAG